MASNGAWMSELESLMSGEEGDGWLVTAEICLKEMVEFVGYLSPQVVRWLVLERRR